MGLCEWVCPIAQYRNVNWRKWPQWQSPYAIQTVRTIQCLGLLSILNAKDRRFCLFFLPSLSLYLSLFPTIFFSLPIEAIGSHTSVTVIIVVLLWVFRSLLRLSLCAFMPTTCIYETFGSVFCLLLVLCVIGTYFNLPQFTQTYTHTHTMCLLLMELYYQFCFCFLFRIFV